MLISVALLALMLTFVKVTFENKLLRLALLWPAFYVSFFLSQRSVEWLVRRHSEWETGEPCTRNGEEGDALPGQ
jgi:hypothetical protein